MLVSHFVESATSKEASSRGPLFPPFGTFSVCFDVIGFKQVIPLIRGVANKFSPHLGTFRDPYFSTSWVSLLSLSGTFSVLFDFSSD